MLQVKMPYNCAHAAYLMDSANGSACVALISAEDAIQISKTGSCSRWAQCHEKTDTYETWYSPVEADALVDFLVAKLV
jgi:hypothetical protein